MSLGSERGMSTVLAMLAICIGGGLVMFVGSLFLTGLAQKRIIPLMSARVDAAISSLPLVGEDDEGNEGGSADSTLGATAPDSVEAFLTQLETHRTFLDRQREDLLEMRADLDSLTIHFQTGQSEEVTRQAKLFAGMGETEAAKILRNVDDATLVAILRKMNSRAAAKVMAELDPRRLARLSMEGIGAEMFQELANVKTGGDER